MLDIWYDPALNFQKYGMEGMRLESSEDWIGAWGSRGDGHGGKTIGRARWGRASSDGPMGRPEFLRIPILRNLTCSDLHQLEPATSHHRRWQRIALSIRPTTRSLSSARCADHAGEVLPALDARICRPAKWRRAHFKGMFGLFVQPSPSPSHDRIDNGARPPNCAPDPADCIEPA
jgi:hypothetical protein